MQDKKHIRINWDDLKSNRRDFLKYMGFSGATLAFLTTCKQNPVNKALPYFSTEELPEPGKKRWYASTCQACQASCPILVKTFENRPIKIEGNPKSPATGGGTCAFGQASLMGLYQDNRLKETQWKGQQMTCEGLDKKIIPALHELNGQNKKIILLSHTQNSPTAKEVFKQFKKRFPKAEWITYDPVSSFAQIKANQKSFGKAILASLNLRKARIIVSFGADFLSTWHAPVRYAHEYAESRKPGKTYQYLYHVQFESKLSLSGTNADKRITIKPGEEGNILVSLYNAIARKLKKKQLPKPPKHPHEAFLDKLAVQLTKNKGRSLTISDSQDESMQMIINGINSLLENFGRTIDLDNPAFYREGNDDQIIRLKKDLELGRVGAVMLWNCNPVYDLNTLNGFESALKKATLRINLNHAPDESAELCNISCPGTHFLENWGDQMPETGFYHLSQPTINPIFKTRQAEESLLKWAGLNDAYYDFLKRHWKKGIFNKQNQITNFEDFWGNCLHEGFYLSAKNKSKRYNFNLYLASAANKVLQENQSHDKLMLDVYEHANLKNGSQYNNPWLLELPDPVSKQSWGNAALISPETAQDLKLRDDDLVIVSHQNKKIELPVLINVGIAKGCVAVAHGFGHQNQTGPDVKVLFQNSGTHFNKRILPVELSKTRQKDRISRTQTAFNIKGLDYLEEYALSAYERLSSKAPPEKPKVPFTQKRTFPTHHWAMVIDLNACIGCQACVTACQVENNIAVTGPKNESNTREMYWMRIDLYHHGDPKNPGFSLLPIHCQHCDRAPCEPVCPVAATTNSKEGINQQNYQRCIGTRFCASNCPYKVRRFNYKNHTANTEFYNEISRMALNPEVSVREKGVIEKCSFCIQRIQEAKIIAKTENKVLKDGDIQTACQQSCPTKAIHFGDLNDPSSKVSQLAKSKRAFRLLEGLNTKPSVYYLAKVRNDLIKDETK